MKKRRFYHIEGFSDNTKYLEWVPTKGMYIVLKDGTKRRAWHWALKDARDAVARGIWVEK